jgi:integrase
MTPRKRKSRIYWRASRAWGDFRDYADAGGRLEALTPAGERLATRDPDIAQALASARLRELDALRRGRALHGKAKGTALAPYAAEHLQKKARAGKVTRGWMEMAELFLRRAIAFLGAERDLESIGVADVQAWAAHLATLPARPDRRKTPPGKELPLQPIRTMTSGSVRHTLNALSNLYRRAQAEGRVLPGFNPVAAMLEKPSGVRREARWLEVPEASLLLESARTLPSAAPQLKDALPAETAHALIATFLLTGGRSAEILGLEVADVSFDRRTVTFRLNDWRRLKTLKSARVVPLWPQLAEILQPFVFGRPPSRLLFPSFVTGREAMLTDWRGTLDRVAERAGWKRGEIRSRMFRHSYCAARLQTLDGGAPVSPFTVSRELGHGSGVMVEEVYSHLGAVRHRTEVVEYRVEQHQSTLAERLAVLGIGQL